MTVATHIRRLICLNVVAFDPLRRRRVRSAAKRLVPSKAWATKDSKADEIARIALLRVLFLQHEAHRAARHREEEATAMLARASIETAISGLFCIYVPGAEKLFEGEMSKRAKSLFSDFTKDIGMPGILDDALANIGSSKLPTVACMVEQIVASGGAPDLGSLKTNFYDQISTLYVHGGPLGLIRHVHPRTGATRGRPYAAWSKRSAVHTSDAMVGLLAASIAGENDADIALFRAYEEDHFRVTWRPLAFVVRGVLASHVDFRYILDTLRAVRRLRAKRKAGEPLTEADIAELLTKLYMVTRLNPDDPSLAPVEAALRAKLHQNARDP